MIISFDFDDDFVSMFTRACRHEYTMCFDGKLNEDELRVKLLELQQTKRFQDKERLGLLKIYDGDTLVGLSVPRVVERKEYRAWGLTPDKDYYRMGMIFIDEPFRGKGYAKEAARFFHRTYKNVLWVIDPLNEASKKVASSIGLTHNKTLYIKGTAWQHHPWQHERTLEIWNN